MSDASSAITDLRHADHPPSGIGWQGVVQTLIITALVIAVYWQALDFMVHTWQSDGDWSHGWLVPLFSLYFLSTQRDRLRAAPRQMNLLGLGMMLVSLAAYYTATHYQVAYPARLTLVPFLMGLVLLMFGWPVSKLAWFPIAYLVLAIPLPGWMFFQVTLPLRRIASIVAGTLLNLLPDVFTEVNGVVIEYEHMGQTGSLNIEEACSGMRLMMAFVALGVAVAYLGKRPLWHRVLLVAFCVPIAVFCNMIRVFTTGVIHIYGDKDLSQGTAHELLGLAMLPIALGLFSFAGWILNNLFVDASEEESAKPA